LVTDRLIFIHVYRTGGYLVRSVLRQIPGLRIIHDHLHLSYERMAGIAHDVLGYIPPALVFHRNPFSWYVSMWGIVWQNPRIGFTGSFREYMEGIGVIDDPNFVTFTQNWTELGADRAKYIERFEALPGALEYPLCLLTHIDLLQLLPILHGEPRFHPALEWPSRQRTKHYSHYYDKDTKHMVEDWDGELIERLGYGFDHA